MSSNNEGMSRSPSRPPSTSIPATTVPRASSQQTYTFEKILNHRGPLKRGMKGYLGSAFNLHILWSTGQKTWEPLHTILEDAPDDVRAYVESCNLSTDPAWAAILQTHQPEPASIDDADIPDGAFVLDDEFEPLTYEEAKQKALNAARRYHRLKGVNGETCYVLIIDRKSGAMQVSIRRDKTPPVDFMKEWIAKYASTAPNRVVRFDQGGELGKCQDTHDLFREAGYDVQFTATAPASEIGLVERCH